MIGNVIRKEQKTFFISSCTSKTFYPQDIIALGQSQFLLLITLMLFPAIIKLLEGSYWSQSWTVNKIGQRFSNEAKISQMRVLPSCAGDIILEPESGQYLVKLGWYQDPDSITVCQSWQEKNEHFSISQNDKNYLICQKPYLGKIYLTCTLASYPLLQPATRGRSRCFGFTFWELSCCPSL